MTLGGKCGSPTPLCSGPTAILSVKLISDSSIGSLLFQRTADLDNLQLLKVCCSMKTNGTAGSLALKLLTSFGVLKHLQYETLLFIQKQEQTHPSVSSPVVLRSCHWSLNTALSAYMILICILAITC